MKRGIQNETKRVNVNVKQMQVFVTIKNAGMKINIGVNAKNYLIKVHVTKDLFGILVIVSANMINSVTLVSTQIMKTVNVGKNQLINQLKNVLKMLKKQGQLKTLLLKINININAVLPHCTLCCFR